MSTISGPEMDGRDAAPLRIVSGLAFTLASAWFGSLSIVWGGCGFDSDRVHGFFRRLFAGLSKRRQRNLDPQTGLPVGTYRVIESETRVAQWWTSNTLSPKHAAPPWFLFL